MKTEPARADRPGELGQSTLPALPRYVLLDNNLVHPGGHSHAMALALLSSNAQLEVWAHSRTSVEDARVKRVFSLSLADRRSAFSANDGSLAFKLGWLKRVVRSNFAYYRDLQKSYPGDTAIWIANNGDMRTFIALLWFAARHRSEAQVVVYFHIPPPRMLRGAGLVAKLLAVRNVQIALPHPRLAESYSRVLALPCTAVSYPLPPSNATSVQPVGERPPTVGIALGAPRLDKGFDILVEAIGILREEFNAGTLQMIVQCDAAVTDSQVGPSLRTLESLAATLSGLHLVRETLSADSYQSLLASTHFVVLPYRARSYSQRISAVLLEGMAAGKPAIVTAGTLSEDTLLEFGGGLAAEDGNGSSLAKAILKLVDDYDHQAAIAAANREGWLRRCDPADFLRRIADLTQA